MNVRANTIMLGDEKPTSIAFKNGHINADNIFISNKCNISSGDTKFSGVVYWLNPQDFNNIYWTWANQGIKYNYETLDRHSEELQDISYKYNNIENQNLDDLNIDVAILEEANLAESDYFQ
ncbi:hypothetical protein [Rickettsiales endosymbiont of Stachyamoeba lipophora]|uniref:hypothetical protein n=1 Tax=Rickettsiales endosymbiont of Stachyamoeba lipophora TaxID=2486578 RepID=UPI000F6518AC|nr:hypothetical protein [Rickettsiales endosymbiont of Stachyamoeba lipophora]AZL15715.1 hypothetical protein EF513_04025 [Rickettsiales endosymbiont of Stachyamoeba lipophora]